MEDCVFCKIVRKDVFAEILFEDEHVLSILDINPIHFGHSLVIPKMHCREFLDLPAQSFPSILTAAQTVTRGLVRGLGLEGYNLFTNNGRVAGQSVFHFHLHITPRYPDDNIRFVLELKTYGREEMAKTADLIRHHLRS